MPFVTCTTLENRLADKQDKLVNSSGGALAAGSCVFTCAEVTAAIANSGNVTAGTNVTLSGDGTSANPYVVGVPNSTGTLRGAVSLATAAEYPSASNDTEAATPAYVAAAIAALPADKYLQGLQSYNAATNTMTLLMNDGTTVTVDMSTLVADAVAEAALTDCQGNTLNPGDSVIACPGTAGTTGQVLTVQPDGTSAWATPAAGGLTSVAHDATMTGDGTAGNPLSVVSTPMLKCGNWEISCDGAGNLVFLNGGTRVAKIEPNGHITSANDVSAFCTV